MSKQTLGSRLRISKEGSSGLPLCLTFLNRSGLGSNADGFGKPALNFEILSKSFQWQNKSPPALYTWNKSELWQHSHDIFYLLGPLATFYSSLGSYTATQTQNVIDILRKNPPQTWLSEGCLNCLWFLKSNTKDPESYHNFFLHTLASHLQG